MKGKCVVYHRYQSYTHDDDYEFFRGMWDVCLAANIFQFSLGNTSLCCDNASLPEI